MNKVAILTDTGCDIPKEVAQELGIYQLPLKINYSYGEFLDGVNITPKEVYDSLKNEIPKTSLPSGEEIENIFKQIKEDGYKKLLCVTLSSGLSGTNNMLNLMAKDEKELEIKIIDSKNIAIASGFLGIYAQNLANQGLDLEEIYNKTLENVQKSTVFFCVDTLEYLQKGGRIGLLTSLIGTKLNLKPIISCNEDGIYYTVAKVLGRKQSIKKLIDIAEKYAKTAKEYVICISHGGAYDDIKDFTKIVEEKFKTAKQIYHTEISPTLSVHTGPGLLGIGVHILA